MGLLTGALVAAGVVGGGAAVWAAGPKPQVSGNQIRGCVSDHGRLRLIWDGHHCHGDEGFISWDRHAPPIASAQTVLPDGPGGGPTATVADVTSVLPAFAAVTGYTVALPGAGTYVISANVRGRIIPADGALCWIVARLATTNPAAPIASSQRLVVLNGIAGPSQVQGTAPIQLLYTATGATTVQVEAARAGTCAAGTTTAVLSDDNGASNIDAVRVGP